MDADSDRVAVINPEGNEFLVMLDGQADGLVNGLVLGPLPPNEEPKLKLVLCFSLSRREKVELILQKCTEIGVFAFQPFISSRSLVQDGDLDAKRLSRWQAIIREACEQAHRQHIPELKPVLSYETLIGGVDQNHLRLVAWEEASLAERLEASKLVVTQRGSLPVDWTGRWPQPSRGRKRAEDRLAGDFTGEEHFAYGNGLHRWQRDRDSPR